MLYYGLGGFSRGCVQSEKLLPFCKVVVSIRILYATLCIEELFFFSRIDASPFNLLEMDVNR